MEVNSDMSGTDKHEFVESSYQVTDNESIPIYADVQTYPCSNCGRCFNAESLRKHQPICKKASQKQSRKLFDAGKQRATDSDVPYAATKETTQFYKEGVKPKPDNQKQKSSNWRDDHNKLVRTIREAKQITKNVESDVLVPKPAASQISTEYIQCEFCQRHFNQYSAERHIPFCETQFKRKQMQYTNSTTTANNTRIPIGRVGGQTRLTQSKHQTSSAPSTLISRRPQKMNGEKDYRRPPINPNVFKRTAFNELSKNSTNGTPSKHSNSRMTKTRSAAGNYLPGTMRTGRTSENDGLNVIAAAEREQHRNDTSPRLQQRFVGVKTRSPSPARRPPQLNGTFKSQQQKIRPPVASTAAKHCHECGEAFPVEWAKFCCECGEKRFGFE